MLCPFVFPFAHFSNRFCNQRRNEFFLPGKLKNFDLRNGFPTFLVRNPFLRSKIFFGCRNCEIVLIPL